MLAMWILPLLVLSYVSAEETVVHTETGDIKGSFEGSCVRFFGIPYAAAPLGPNRFKPPQPALHWTGVRDATQDVHSICLQNRDAGMLESITDGVFGLRFVQRFLDFLFGKEGSEDCLFINVQTPEVKPAKLLPVMVYIHGGSNLIGSGADYDASSLCTRSVVFISFNYRLGALGNVALSGALSESGTAGNYGLQDQRKAFEWVQQNIEKFGGDPNAVTLSGESAGAMAVAAHMGLPRSQNLFARGIMMSGTDMSLPLTEALSMGTVFAKHVGCDAQEPDAVLACLRGMDAEKMVSAQLPIYNQTMRAQQVPVEDGYELPVGTSLRDLFATGQVPPKPLLAGTNLNDSSLFYGLTPREVVRGIVNHDIAHTIKRFFMGASQSQREEIHKLYDPKTFGGARLALYALGTDGYFECPTRRILNSFAGKDEAVYHYIYAAVPVSPASAFGLPSWMVPVVNFLIRHVAPLRWLGVYHGSNEVVFWGAEDSTSGLSVEERQLGERMLKAWTEFVHGRDPWEPYGSREYHSWLDVHSHEKAGGYGWHVDQCNELQKFRFIWNPLEEVLSDGIEAANLTELVV